MTIVVPVLVTITPRAGVKKPEPGSVEEYKLRKAATCAVQRGMLCAAVYGYSPELFSTHLFDFGLMPPWNYEHGPG